MNDQDRPLPPPSGETAAEPSDLPSEATERQQVVKLAAEAIDRRQDAVSAGEEGLTELLCAMRLVHAARALGISDKEITAARRTEGTAYHIAHRRHGPDLWPYLSKAGAFDECEKRTRRDHPDAVLRWGTESEDDQASASSPWVLFREDENGDLVDTGYTITPLPTKIRPVPGVGITDEQT